jgi:hypothetical protein
VLGFVQKEVIDAVIQWILGLLIPGAGFTQAVMGIHDIVHFFVTRASQVMELVSAVIDSLEAIVGGAVGVIKSWCCCIRGLCSYCWRTRRTQLPV